MFTSHALVAREVYVQARRRGGVHLVRSDPAERLTFRYLRHWQLSCWPLVSGITRRSIFPIFRFPIRNFVVAELDVGRWINYQGIFEYPNT